MFICIQYLLCLGSVVTLACVSECEYGYCKAEKLFCAPAAQASATKPAALSWLRAMAMAMLLVLTAAYPALAVKCFQTLHCVQIDTRAFVAIERLRRVRVQ